MMPADDTSVPPEVRAWIEERYYARVNRQASLASIARDPAFLSDPQHHIAFYADHGVVHARDVAARVPAVLDRVNGVLIPRRGPERLDGFMKPYGGVGAYLHDIGMFRFSHFGRSTHPAFAAQEVFEPSLDEVVGALWSGIGGTVAARLEGLGAGAALPAPALIFRELLAMSVCHSKSYVPVELLNDPSRLREVMCEMVRTDLRTLYVRRGGAPSDVPAGLPAKGRAGVLRRLYANFDREGFAWLTSGDPAARELVADVVDTLRALRAADAFRQRGTTLKTSAQYQVFVDQFTANAICAINSGDGLYLVEVPDPIFSAEANLAGSEFDDNADLHFTFQRGAFADAATARRAAAYAAPVIDDIVRDAVGSFRRPNGDGWSVPASGSKRSADVRILLEATDDNPDFASLVLAELERIAPSLGTQIDVVPAQRRTAGSTAAGEWQRYRGGSELSADLVTRRGWLSHIAATGHLVGHIDLAGGFDGVRRILLRTGDTLVRSGDPSDFVYIPLGEGLQIRPLGGYESVSAPAWMPVGMTGVVRGSTRNSTVVTCRDLELLVIPKEVYLRCWYRPYSIPEFLEHVVLPMAASAPTPGDVPPAHDPRAEAQ